MPNRCPGCGKLFPNPTRLLQHMNQPRGHCISSQLRFVSRANPAPSPDDDGDDIDEGDSDGDWMEVDADLGNNVPEEPFDFIENSQACQESYPGASANYGRGHTFMDTFDGDRFSLERQHNLFYPFSSKIEWELASWLSNSGLSMAAIDEFLSLDSIRSLPLSFRTAKALRKRIELLPSGPRWKSQPVKPESPMKHPLQLFYRDAIECIQHLIHSPSINGQIEFIPKKVYTTADRIERVYTEWLTGDRAWELQDALPDGATLLGVVLSSDKTHITQVGNRQAHPLLISLANISADVRRKNTTKSYLLLALLPVPKFTHANTRLHGVLADRLLHQVISIVVKLLKKAAEAGRMMSDPLGNLKYCFTPLAAHIANTPEQRAIACVTSNASAVTTAVSEQFGDPICCAARTASTTRRRLIAVKRMTRAPDLASYFRACRKRYLNGVSSPFWLDWPLAEPSSFITPEPLHQFFKMLWDHDREWCSRMLGDQELDFRFSLLQTCSGHRHFPDGITTLKQTSMRLHHEVQRYIVGVVAGGIPRDALAAIRALTDFRYRSQAPRLTDTDVADLASSLQEFHDKKAALTEAGARGSLDHWKIPKLEMMLSIAPSISNMGTLGQWSADVTEHAHIDVVKDPARSRNNQNFDTQICRYLDRQEKCYLFSQAMAIRDLELRGDIHSSNDSGSEEDDRPTRKTRKITDYFKRASALTAGRFPTAPLPFRTFASSATAFHLSSKPAMMNITVDDTAQLYELSDFKPAIADYLAHRHPNSTYTIGGRQHSSPDCQLPFDRIQIWSKMRIQLYSSYDSKVLLPSQSLHASPASTKWPLGRYDTVIVSGDGNMDWPRNGLRGQVVPYLARMFLLTTLLQGHEIVQLRLIFKPINISNPLPNIFFAYVQRFTISMFDEDAGMYILKRALRSTGERVGDIIPLFQIHSPAHIIPHFGQSANSQLCSWSSNKLSSSFWLNKYWTKEFFHSCSQ